MTMECLLAEISRSHFPNAPATPAQVAAFEARVGWPLAGTGRRLKGSRLLVHAALLDAFHETYPLEVRQIAASFGEFMERALSSGNQFFWLKE